MYTLCVHYVHTRYGVECTRFGLRVNGIACQANLATMHWQFTTTGNLMMIHAALGNPWIAAVYFLSAIVPVIYLTEHDKFHASKETRSKRYGPTWLSRMFCTDEYDRLSSAHMDHHHNPKYANQRFGLIPYNRFANLLVFGEY